MSRRTSKNLLGPKDLQWVSFHQVGSFIARRPSKDLLGLEDLLWLEDFLRARRPVKGLLVYNDFMKIFQDQKT